MDPSSFSRSSNAVSVATRLSSSGIPSGDISLLAPGTILNTRYEIIDLIGRGGMGAVYKAHDRELERFVALKTIRSDLVNVPAVLQRFKQELVLAREVTHKNVVRIFDLGESDGLKFITMEFVDGEDLASILAQRGRIPPADAAAIMAQVCAGLSAAHAEGVLHRDLKPGNIMRDAHGRVKVMDFGLARTSDSSGLTQTGAMLGTIEYMSPEQARGEVLDARSDLYAIGLIFYELLTGDMPFKSESAIASLWKRMQERVAPISSFMPDVPPALSEIVQRCLEPDRNQRYQSADEIVADLKHWAELSLPARTLPSPTVATSQAVPLLRRIPRRNWAVVALAVLLLVAGATLYRLRTAARPASHQPVTALVADFDNRTTERIFDGTLEPSFTLALEDASFISSFPHAQAIKVAAEVRPGVQTMNEEVSRLIAVREGVNIVISGAIEQAEGQYRVTIRAMDPTNGRVMLTQSANAASKDAVLQAVTRLAAAVRTALGDTVPESVQIAAGETFTSGSLEAAHEYAVAQDLQWAGNWEEAIKHYSRALELDPKLGRAYAGLAATNANMGRRQEAEKYYKLALANIDRMSEREKRRTRGGYYLMMRESRKASEEYAALVKEFPADAAGYGNLALAHFYSRDMSAAMEQAKRAVQLTPKSLLQRNNLALYALYAGDFKAARQQAEEVIRENPSYLNAYGALAMAQMGEGDTTAASATYGRLQQTGARGASMSVLGTADIAAYEGRHQDAIAILDTAIQHDVSNKDAGGAATKLIAQADSYVQMGDKKHAIAAAERALALDPQPTNQFAVGRIYVALNDSGKAASIATRLVNTLESEPQMYGHLLRGEIALRAGNAVAAAQSYKQAQGIGDSWLAHFGLGRAYLAAGAYPDAYSEFEKCLNRRGEASSIFLDDVPTFRAVPETYYYMARAQQGLNSPAAKVSYAKFLSMKKGEDALVADARRRAAQL